MLQVHFEKLAGSLEANEAKIDAALIAVQGKPLDTGGYYLPDPAKTAAAMAGFVRAHPRALRP